MSSFNIKAFFASEKVPVEVPKKNQVGRPKQRPKIEDLGAAVPDLEERLAKLMVEKPTEIIEELNAKPIDASTGIIEKAIEIDDSSSGSVCLVDDEERDVENLSDGVVDLDDKEDVESCSSLIVCTSEAGEDDFEQSEGREVEAPVKAEAGEAEVVKVEIMKKEGLKTEKVEVKEELVAAAFTSPAKKTKIEHGLVSASSPKTIEETLAPFKAALATPPVKSKKGALELSPALVALGLSPLDERMVKKLMYAEYG